MKLDRNINSDGLGKYAIINLRTNAIEYGEDGNQFFVIKYKDRFAEPALLAYALAVRIFADAQPETIDGAKLHCEMHEFADEIEREAEIAAAYSNKQVPS